MQASTENLKDKNEMQGASMDRPRLKLSELSDDKVADLTHMFGLWKEADHCDKD